MPLGECPERQHHELSHPGSQENADSLARALIYFFVPSLQESKSTQSGNSTLNFSAANAVAHSHDVDRYGGRKRGSHTGLAFLT